MVRMTIVAAFLAFAGSIVRAEGPEYGEWQSLFDGKGTTGWVKAKAGQPDRPWTVEDAALTNSGAVGMDLATEREFDNYELEIEYRLDPKSNHKNSGVYLRGQIEVQIDDSSGRKEVGPHGCGAIYSRVAPTENAGKPAGQWNAYRIRHLGNRISVLHNGVLIHDAVFIDSATGGSMDGLDLIRGPIMLQGDHGPVWYRNARIRTVCGRAEGWEPIWNDRDLSELDARGASMAEVWEVSAAPRAITNKKWYDGPAPGDRGRDLWTKRAFRDFLVHWEYRSDPGQQGGNSGFYLRDQWEVQILGAQSLDEKHCDGSLYDRYPPRIIAWNGPGKWNEMSARVLGRKISVWQNGKALHEDVELATRTDSPAPAVDEARPFKLQGDHGRVWFRNLWIKPIAADAGFVPLFDGKSLNGWEQKGGKALYRVEDGSIVGQSVPDTPNSFLCTKREYGDFILEYEFRCDPALNAGVQVRSSAPGEETTYSADQKTIEVPAGRVHGYQVEIDPNKPERMWTAGIYDEGRRGWLYPGSRGGDAAKFSEQGKRLYRKGDWNVVRVEAIGPSIKTWLNGEARANLTDDMTPRGFIALQVHGVGGRKERIEVRWRNLRIRPLDN